VDIYTYMGAEETRLKVFLISEPHGSKQWASFSICFLCKQLTVLMVQEVMWPVQSVWAWRQRQKFALMTKRLDTINCLRLNIPTWRCLHLLQSSDSLATANQSALCIPAHRLMCSFSGREFHFYDGSVELIKFYTNLKTAVFFLLGNFPASEFYVPMFQNTLSVPSSGCANKKNNRDETAMVFIQISIWFKRSRGQSFGRGTGRGMSK